jgi:hypothetical protein
MRVGSELRAKMLMEIEKKLPLTGYRPMWIKQSAHEVIALLRDVSERFNDTHSTDQASIIDMLDMLSTASNLLTQALSSNQTGQASHIKPPQYRA